MAFISHSARATASVFRVAISILVTACTDLVLGVVDLWYGATSWCAESIAAVSAKLPKLVHSWPSLSDARVELIRARAFVFRMLSRDMPRLTPGWRQCPSI